MREPITIIACERCEAEERSDKKPYWGQCHAHVSWRVPPDGINCGKFEGVLCYSCRQRIITAINDAFAKERKL